MNYKLSQCHNFFSRRTLIVASSYGDREKRRFEMLQKGISPSPVSFWPSQRPSLTSRLVLK
ncbi:unnamed protein product [Brassica napus]|uniref:(rape) hypothetical protein n=1 Tax=Brassica napus TaxID=3708 RepID=A0A816J633_BRANA|nr:unnamed protein product [Brassica napus]